MICFRLFQGGILEPKIPRETARWYSKKPTKPKQLSGIPKLAVRLVHEYKFHNPIQYVFEGMTDLGDLKPADLGDWKKPSLQQKSLPEQKETTEAEKEAALQDLQVGKGWTMGRMEGHALMLSRVS